MFEKRHRDRGVTRVSDQAVEYRFTKPVTHQRAAAEFAKARAAGLPSGSLIVTQDEW